MRKFLHRVNNFLSAFSGWLMLVMMALLLVDIVSRGIDKPFQGIAEMSVFVMMVVIYLGLPRCEEHDENVRIEILIHFLSWKYRKYLLSFINLIQLGVIGVFLFEMIRNTLIAFKTHEAVAGTVQLPIWPVKIFIVIGLLFYLMAILMNTIDSIQKLKQKVDPLSEREKSEGTGPQVPPDMAF